VARFVGWLASRSATLSGPRYIPDSLHVPLPSYPLCSHPILYPSLHPPLGGTRTAASRGPSPKSDDRRQNQTTVARTRRPSPEPDDRCQNQMTVLEPDNRYQNYTTTFQTTSHRIPRTIQLIDRSNSILAHHRIESRPPTEAP
jgi:hypothetical protein